MAKVQPSSLGEIMELLNKDAGIMVLDTEPIFYPPPKKVFDFGYVITNSTGKNLNLTGLKQYNKLVYEALIDREYMFSIRKWGKLTGAAEGSLYGFYNLMIKNGYIFNNSEQSEGDLKSELATIQGLAMQEVEKIMSTRREDVLRIQYEHLKRKEDDINYTYKTWWELGGSRYGWDMTKASNRKNKENAYMYKKQYSKSKGLFLQAMASNQRLDQVTQSLEKAGLKKESRALKHTVLKIAYEEQKRQYYRDIVQMPSLASLKAVLKINDIKNWDYIIEDFLTDIKRHGVVAVTGYNVAADRSFLRNSNDAWSNKNKGKDVLDAENFDVFCLMNMYKKFNDNINAEKVKDYLLTHLGVSAEEAYKEAIVTGKGDLKFEMAYKTVFNQKDYKEKHTAIEDALDETEFLSKLMEEILSKNFK